MKVTRKKLEEWTACEDGKEFFLKLFPKGTDAVTGVKGLIKEDKLEWANWLVCRRFNKKQKIQYAVYAAKQVLHIFEKEYPEDKRPREAINAAIRCIKLNTKKNRAAAWAACDAAGDAAWDAMAAARDARAADRDARAAAWAARDAAWAAGDAAMAALASAGAAAWDAARAAAWAAEAAARAAEVGGAARREMQLKILKHGIKLLKEKRNEII